MAGASGVVGCLSGKQCDVFRRRLDCYVFISKVGRPCRQRSGLVWRPIGSIGPVCHSASEPGLTVRYASDTHTDGVYSPISLTYHATSNCSYSRSILDAISTYYVDSGLLRSRTGVDVLTEHAITIRLCFVHLINCDRVPLICVLIITVIIRAESQIRQPNTTFWYIDRSPVSADRNRDTWPLNRHLSLSFRSWAL